MAIITDLDAYRAETERFVAASRAETEKILADSRARVEEILAANRAETEKILAEGRSKSEAALSESRTKAEQTKEEAECAKKELERAMKELADAQQETQRALKHLSAKMGGLNNSVGQLVQMVVLPGIKNKMNALGHNFTMASPEKDYYKANGDTLTDVDLLLENCQDVMVVEVKTTLTVNDIEHHLERLRLLRKNEEITGMTGKTMYAAVAYIRCKSGARERAVEKGMYLIEIEEDEEGINILPPENVGKW